MAGAGIPVAKHGNRSYTSRSGSADVLEALGIDIALTPERAAQVLSATGFVFLFAPTYHPAMRHLGGVRRGIGIPTIMNLLGPLVNPAGVGRPRLQGAGQRAEIPLLFAPDSERRAIVDAWESLTVETRGGRLRSTISCSAVHSNSRSMPSGDRLAVVGRRNFGIRFSPTCNVSHGEWRAARAATTSSSRALMRSDHRSR